MGYQSQTGESLASDGDFVTVPGYYHLFVTDSDDPATKRDGSLLDGAVMNLHTEVISSTVPGQEKKPFQITLWEPKPGDNDGGKFRGQVLERFAIALGLVSGPKQQFALNGESVKVPKSTGQFVVSLQKRKKADGTEDKYLEPEGLKIYHVDDLIVAAVVGNDNSRRAIRLIAPSMRRTAKKETPPANGNANGNGNAQQQAVGAGAGGANGIDTSNL